MMLLMFYQTFLEFTRKVSTRRDIREMTRHYKGTQLSGCHGSDLDLFPLESRGKRSHIIVSSLMFGPRDRDVVLLVIIKTVKALTF